MTNKLVDGIDVSDCEYYSQHREGYCGWYNLCEGRSCSFKIAKCKQEIKEYRQALDEILEKCDSGIICLSELSYQIIKTIVNQVKSGKFQPTESENNEIVLLRNKELKEDNRLLERLISYTLRQFGLQDYDMYYDQNEISTELQSWIDEHNENKEALNEIRNYCEYMNAFNKANKCNKTNAETILETINKIKKEREEWE